jgi:hypothetical protein
VPDLPIVIPDTAAVPKDYTLSGTQELALKTVRALIDGSGAGSAFLPTLQLLDPNGHVMWEGATSSTVAAGASADVSWFPGLGATGSSTPGTSHGATAFVWGVFGAQTIPTGGAGANITWAHFQTNDTTIFGTDTAAGASPPFHNTTGDSYLYFTGTGSYVSAAGVQLAAGAYAQSMVIDNPGGQWVLEFPGTPFAAYEALATNTDVFGVAANQQPVSRRLFYVDGTTGNGVIRLHVTQTSGANKGVISVSAGMVYGDGGTGNLTSIY